MEGGRGSRSGHRERASGHAWETRAGISRFVSCRKAALRCAASQSRTLPLPGPALLAPAAASARLAPRHAGICTRKALRGQSPAERHAYRAFLQRLALHAADVAVGCSPAAAAGIAYGSASLGVGSAALGAALISATSLRLREAAAAAAAAVTAPPRAP